MQPISLLAFGARVMDAVQRGAATNAPVLLSGETGAGKTVLARHIHAASARTSRPFMRVDCGSVPETLFEREMFGHVRGAFTDAKDSQPGIFEATDGGTVFLDEIGDVPLAVQSKLLAVLDDGHVRRVGSTRATRVDARIVAASNRDLPEMVRAKQFRSDLYYRLAFLKIHVPPLRDRRDSIPVLAEHLLKKLIAERRVSRSATPTIDGRAIECLLRYSWPGNIRELEQVLTYALTYFDTDVITPEQLPAELVAPQTSWSECGERTAHRYIAPHDLGLERQSLVEALNACDGNRARTAKQLGMCRATLWTKLRQFGIEVQYGAVELAGS